MATCIKGHPLYKNLKPVVILVSVSSDLTYEKWTRSPRVNFREMM